MHFENTPLSRKLGIGFAIVVGTTFFGSWKLQKSFAEYRDTNDGVVKRAFEATQAARSAADSSKVMSMMTLEFITSQDAATKKAKLDADEAAAARAKAVRFTSSS